jgi:hypothetical protein
MPPGEGGRRTGRSKRAAGRAPVSSCKLCSSSTAAKADVRKPARTALTTRSVVRSSFLRARCSESHSSEGVSMVSRRLQREAGADRQLQRGSSPGRAVLDARPVDGRTTLEDVRHEREGRASRGGRKRGRRGTAGLRWLGRRRELAGRKSWCETRCLGRPERARRIRMQREATGSCRDAEREREREREREGRVEASRSTFGGREARGADATDRPTLAATRAEKPNPPAQQLPSPGPPVARGLPRRSSRLTLVYSNPAASDALDRPADEDARLGRRPEDAVLDAVPHGRRRSCSSAKRGTGEGEQRPTGAGRCAALIGFRGALGPMQELPGEMARESVLEALAVASG